ncbi:MAG: WYL domain-containing transcriptional regulator [Ignavibacteriae bacterium]|jgi:predicted DNA-binding transcriptional regulator YafY|nr:WYL domain-containing transcriptional regulator [Ignavibacteriota bacterium]
MLDIHTKFKRQAEILGLALMRDGSLSKTELEKYFGVEELTIKRDLENLRASGIDIHTTKGVVEIQGTINQESLKSILIQYLGMCYSYNSYDKPSELMVRKLKDKALTNVVVIQRCIEENRKVLMTYEKESGTEKTEREICPLQMFQSENYWRVLAIHDGIIKQFLLNKIVDIRPLESGFKPVPKEELDELFANSWRSWVGNEKFEVKLLLSEKWTKKVKPRQVMEKQEIIDRKDGWSEFKITVNSLDEIAGWVVSRGNGVKVIEPEILKQKVIDIASGTLGNYK